MNRPVAHGAIVLAISLAAVGAIATADRGAASASPEAAPLLQSKEVAVAADGSGVQIRDARVEAAATSDSDVSGPTPVRIQVAGIALDAPVIPVGVDDESRFAVPAATTVGWYRYGPRPGEPGASVLAAHVDYAGRHGAFFRLAQLKPGDRLQLALDNGRTLTFQVTGVFQVDKTQLPADELFRTDGASVLHLITCGGTFNPQKHSYDANVVVTAEPVGLPSIPA